MISRKQIQETVDQYYNTPDKIKIGTIASHSGLDVCDGAVEENFKTVAYCKKGREQTYSTYFKAQRDVSGNLIRGIVDDAVVFNNFNEILKPENQQQMLDDSVLMVPNRSLTSYCSIDDIEDNFKIPMIGSRNMLRSEERSEAQSYYWILEKAGLPFPEKIEKPEDIDAFGHGQTSARRENAGTRFFHSRQLRRIR